MALTKPFAENGNKSPIPETTVDGSVSYDQGFGSFYALPPEEGGLFIDRAQFNQLMYDTTSQVLANKAQLNSIFAGDKSPYLLQPSAINIAVGTGGNFTNLNDAFSYIKQTNSKQINTISSITLLSDFNDDLILRAFPPCLINCNGFKLGNNLQIISTPYIQLNNLKLDGQINAFLCGLVSISGNISLGSGNSGSIVADSSIYANSSNISISGNIVLNPSATSNGITSKGISTVYLVYPSTWTQNVGANFVYIVSGGIVTADTGVDLSGIGAQIPKSNIAANTLSPYGRVFGTIWG